MAKVKDPVYNAFLFEFSGHYTGIEFRKLRFCLGDHLKGDGLQKETGKDLLDELGKTTEEILVPVISSTRVNMLWEIAVLTNKVAVQECVCKYVVNKQLRSIEGEGLKAYRKILYEGLMEVTRKDESNVTAFYIIGDHAYTNKWDTVLHLETDLQLTTRANLKIFAEILNARAKEKLHEVDRLVPKNEGFLKNLRPAIEVSQAEKETAIAKAINKVRNSIPVRGGGNVLATTEFVSRLENVPLENKQQLHDDINKAYKALLQTTPPEDIRQLIQVDRNQILDQLVSLYKDDGQLPTKRIKVEFVGEPAQDYGGLSKEMFTSFWSKAAESNLFGGEHVKVPFLDRHRRRRETWKYKSVGAILSHSVVVTGSLPSEIAMSVIIQLFGREVDEVCLLHDFMLYVTSTEKKILSKAIDKFDDLTEDEKKDLESIFVAYRYNAEPRREDIKEQIMDIAEDWLITEPSKLIAEMRKGVPESHVEHFWKRLLVTHLRYIALVQRPTSETVVDVIKSTKEDHTDAEENCFYFLKEFVGGITDQKVLNAFLTMVTGSIHQPNKISVSFTSLVGLERRPISHTCDNLIEIPTSYETQQVFKQEMMSVLNHPDATTYSAI